MGKSFDSDIVFKIFQMEISNSFHPPSSSPLSGCLLVKKYELNSYRLSPIFSRVCRIIMWEDETQANEMRTKRRCSLSPHSQISQTYRSLTSHLQHISTTHHLSLLFSEVLLRKGPVLLERRKSGEHGKKRETHHQQHQHEQQQHTLKSKLSYTTKNLEITSKSEHSCHIQNATAWTFKNYLKTTTPPQQQHEHIFFSHPSFKFCTLSAFYTFPFYIDRFNINWIFSTVIPHTKLIIYWNSI